MLSFDDFSFFCGDLFRRVKQDRNILYLKEVFESLPISYREFEEAAETYLDECEECRRYIDKAKEIIESRIVRAAMDKNGIPPSTAQFILQNAFGIGKDNASNAAPVTIIYTGIEPQSGDEGEDGSDG